MINMILDVGTNTKVSDVRKASFYIFFVIRFLYSIQISCLKCVFITKYQTFFLLFFAYILSLLTLTWQTKNAMMKTKIKKRKNVCMYT